MSNAELAARASIYAARLLRQASTYAEMARWEEAVITAQSSSEILLELLQWTHQNGPIPSCTTTRLEPDTLSPAEKTSTTSMPTNDTTHLPQS